LQDSLPVMARKPPPQPVSEACALVVQNDRFLIVQRGEGGLWSSFWEFPTVNCGGADPASRSFGHPVSLAEGIERLTGIQAEVGGELTTVRYSVTRYRVLLRVHMARALGGRIKPGPGFSEAVWASRSDLAGLPLGSAARRLVDWINEDPRRLAWR
jgi:adenine-specific DNA glycosylase